MFHVNHYVSRSYDNSGTAILAFPRNARPETYLSNRHEILRSSKEIYKADTSHVTAYLRYVGSSFFPDYRIYCIRLLLVQ